MAADIEQKLRVVVSAENNASSPLGKLKTDAMQALGLAGVTGLSNTAKIAMAGLAVGGIAVVVKGMAEAVTVAKGFEQSMANVRAVTNASNTDFAALTKTAKELGAATAFSASQAAEGMEFLGMAGLSTTEIIEAMPAVLDLAAAGTLGLGEAADTATNIMSGMGLEVSDLRHVMDGLAVAASSSNTDVRGLGQAMSFVAGTAKNAGVSFDETTAALGLLGNAGIQATRGGTGLNAALRELLNPSKEAKKVMDDLGLVFTTNEGKLRPLVDITRDLEDANITAQQAFVLFGDEGQRAINALVSQGSEQLQKLTEDIKNSDGAARRMAEIKMDTFSGSVIELGSALEGLAITVGTPFLGFLRATTEATTNAVRGINGLAESIIKLGEGNQKLDVSAELRALAELGIKFNTEALDINARISEMEALRITLGAQINESRQELRRQGEGIVKDAEDAQTRLEKLNTDLAQNYQTLIRLKQEDAEWVGIGTSAAGAQAAELERLIEKQSATSKALGTMVTAYQNQKRVQEEIQRLEFEKTMVATSEAIEVVSEKFNDWLDRMPPKIRTMSEAYGGFLMTLEERPEVAPIPLEERLGLTPEELKNMEETGNIYGEATGKAIAKGAEKGFAADFERNFQSALEMSLGNIIRTGDFLGALKRFGENMLDGILGGFAKNASQKITDAIFSGGGGSGGGAGGGFLSNLFSSKGGEAGTVGGAAAGAGFTMSFTAALQGGVAVASAAFAAAVTKGIASNIADASWTESASQWAFKQSDEQLTEYIEGIGQDPDKVAAARSEVTRREGLRTQTQEQNQAQSDARVGGVVQGVTDRMVDARREGRFNLTFDEFMNVSAFVGGAGGRDLATEALSRRDSEAGAIEYFISSLSSQFRIPMFDRGGVVPGPMGMPQLAVVHGGETVLPTHRPTDGFVGGGSAGNTINLYFTNTFQSLDPQSARRMISGEFGDMIISRLRQDGYASREVLPSNGVVNAAVV